LKAVNKVVAENIRYAADIPDNLIQDNAGCSVHTSIDRWSWRFIWSSAALNDTWVDREDGPVYREKDFSVELRQCIK